jgi:hypothetical protein
VASAKRSGDAAGKRVYRVVFQQDGKVWEVYARAVTSSPLFGFVEVEGLLFGTRGGVVVDPSEERLRTEFAGVERTHIPLHAVLRIDQVARPGSAKITALPGGAEKVRPFPIPTPGKTDT